MNNFDEKIKNIKETEKQLLEFVKSKIEEKDNIFSENVESVVKVLNYDATMVKKHETILEAQKLIVELTNKIKNAKTVDEIVEIRKKLNYYINKIKKEIKERNIDSNEYDQYVLNATDLRKGISEYIRYLKRESKITEIDTLNNKPELNEEEKDYLKKLVRNEISYGKRNLAKYNNVVDERFTVKLPEKNSSVKEGIDNSMEKIKGELASKKTSKENEVQVSKYIGQGKQCRYFRSHESIGENNPVESTINSKNQELGKYFVKHDKLENDGKPTKNDFKVTTPIKRASIQRSGVLPVKTYNNVHDYLSEKVDSFTERYDVIILEGYTESKAKNIKIFARNLPTILRNKGRIKYMMRDCALINNRKPELTGFTEYTRSENSVMNSIKKALTGSKLVDQETFYRKEHERCIDWIMGFCKANELEIHYPAAKV